MKFSFRFAYLVLLLLPLLLAGCFEPENKGLDNQGVSKRDFFYLWRLNSIKIEGKRDGQKTSKTFTGATFFDNNRNPGTARIEFISSGLFEATLHISAANPIDESLEGDTYFSNGSMLIDAPGKMDWDRLAFKINLDEELYVVIKDYDPALGAPFNNFYAHEAALKDIVTLTFVKYRE